MSVTIKPRICANLIVTENGKSTVHEIHEEDVIRDLKYRKGTEELTVSGAVRVMNCSTTRATITQTCPPESYFNKLVNITSLIIDCSSEFDADLVTVNVSDIISVGEVDRPDETKQVVTIGPGAQYQTIDKVMESLEEGATLKLAKGEYTPAVQVAKSVKIVGANDYPRNNVASEVAVMDAESAPAAVEDTVLSGAITVDGAEAEVELRGLTLTKNALVKVANAKSVKIINCYVEGLVGDIAKTMPFAFTGTTPCKIVIEGCFFGDYTENGANKIYNLIDVYNAMADGSSISNNYFTAKSCTHNQVSLYGIADGAEIKCNGNVFEIAGGYRIGFKGAAKGSIEISENAMGAYDPDPEYAGILCIQPYGTQTTDFSGINVVLDKNEVPEGNLCYVYCGSADTQLTEAQLPKVTVNGAAYTLPVLH